MPAGLPKQGGNVLLSCAGSLSVCLDTITMILGEPFMVSYDAVVSAIIILGSFGLFSNVYIYHTAYRQGRKDARRVFTLRLQRTSAYLGEIDHPIRIAFDQAKGATWIKER
jgi:hypothetical protein